MWDIIKVHGTGECSYNIRSMWYVKKFQYCVFTASLIRSPNRFSRPVIVPRGIGVLYLIFSVDPT